MSLVTSAHNHQVDLGDCQSRGQTGFPAVSQHRESRATVRMCPAHLGPRLAQEGVSDCLQGRTSLSDLPGLWVGTEGCAPECLPAQLAKATQEPAELRPAAPSARIWGRARPWVGTVCSKSPPGKQPVGSQRNGAGSWNSPDACIHPPPYPHP